MLHAILASALRQGSQRLAAGLRLLDVIEHRVAAAPASAEPPGGARSTSSSNTVAAAPASAKAGGRALAVMKKPHRSHSGLG